MKQVLAKAALFAVVSAAASLLIVVALVPLIGGVVEGNALLMALLCPLVIAFPASGHTLWQKKKLSDTLLELTRAHDELADAHMQLAEAHARLSEKARHDDMTGVLNREAFFATLKSLRRRTDSGALLIIDADNFKYINDTHGHQQGDVALKLITEAIRTALREEDLVGRIGGEEFGAFLVGADVNEAVEVAERIRLAVEAIHFSPGEGKYLPLSVSIGASRLRQQLTWSEMMREADRRLYEAKRRGRNRVVFEAAAQAA